MAAARQLSRFGTLLQGWQKNLTTKFTIARSAPKPAAAEFKLPELPEVNEFGETNARPGWIRVTVTAAFLGYMAMNAIPIIADGTVRHPVLLLQVDDPFFQRSGASRLNYLTITNERKAVAVRYGAVDLLLAMIESAPDDLTRISALKALDTLCTCDLAVRVLNSLEKRVALEPLEESSNPEILSLLTRVQEKRSRKSSIGEQATDEAVLGASALAM